MHLSTCPNLLREAVKKTEELEKGEVMLLIVMKKDDLLQVSILLLSLVIAGVWLLEIPESAQKSGAASQKELLALEARIFPSEGVELPIRWGDLGIQLVQSGAIDIKKFKLLYDQRGGMDPDMEKLLTEADNNNVVITKENAETILNLLWALGLANKNEILERGEMTEKRFGSTGNFASTGGWTLARGDAMQHYSRHALLKLTEEQQKLVDEVSKNIYRPCCGNSTHFPDCNHGMAMLGLLELMASQGASEETMYRTALTVNSYWFPDTYLTIAKFLKSKDMSWNKTGAKELLSANFSSAVGYRQILNQIQPTTNGSGSSCGV